MSGGSGASDDGLDSAINLDTRPADRHLERMPGQHRQTCDPQEEPAPRGGWFRLEERPYPERLDRAFRVLAIVMAVAVAGENHS